MPENLRYVYHRNHAKRYAHIPEEQRKEYPDEVVVTTPEGEEIVVKRQYTNAELRELEERPWVFRKLIPETDYMADNFQTNIYAKDVPMSQVLKDAERRREQVARRDAVPVA